MPEQLGGVGNEHHVLEKGASTELHLSGRTVQESLQSSGISFHLQSSNWIPSGLGNEGQVYLLVPRCGIPLAFKSCQSLDLPPIRLPWKVNHGRPSLHFWVLEVQKTMGRLGFCFWTLEIHKKLNLMAKTRKGFYLQSQMLFWTHHTSWIYRPAKLSLLWSGSMRFKPKNNLVCRGLYSKPYLIENNQVSN